MSDMPKPETESELHAKSAAAWRAQAKAARAPKWTCSCHSTGEAHARFCDERAAENDGYAKASP